MITIFTAASPLRRILPWTLTAALLLTWSYCALTTNALGGFVNGFLISGAVMVLVSLYLGRHTISQTQPSPSEGITP